MATFITILQKFDQKGDKTGWTYIDIPVDVTTALKPGQKTTFRVKGKLDNFAISQVALLPMGRSECRTTTGSDGTFIMPINVTMRRGIRKEAGATVRVELDADDSPIPLSADLLDCLPDDAVAQAHFNTLSKSHQNYFSNWIEEAKTPATKADRIAKSIRGLAMGLNFGEMIRYFKRQS